MLRPSNQTEEVHYVEMDDNPNLLVKKIKTVSGKVTDNIDIPEKKSDLYSDLVDLFKKSEIEHPEERAKQFVFLDSKNPKQANIQSILRDALDESYEDTEERIKQIQSGVYCEPNQMTDERRQIIEIENEWEPKLIESLQGFSSRARTLIFNWLHCINICLNLACLNSRISASLASFLEWSS